MAKAREPVVVASDPAAAAILPAEVFDPDRLVAVARTGLMDTGPDEALDDLAALAAVVTGAPRAFITLVDAHRSFWKSAVQVPEGADPEAQAEPADPKVRQNPAADSPCHILVGTGRELVSEDAAADPRIRHLAAVRELRIGAWAGYPIHSADGQVLGGLCVADEHARPWTAGQLRGLATLARAVSASIGVHQELDAAHLEISRLEISGEKATRLARSLQDSLLPSVLARPAWLDAAAMYLPADSEHGQVIGDFFDLFATNGDWWCAVVGDVCGHGLEAAKVTALARYTVRADGTEHTFPAPILARLNQALLNQKINERFLTAVCVALRPAPDRPGAQAVISNGGHPAVLLRRANGTVSRIGPQGTLLGVLDDITLTEETFHLDPGDLLLLYTDGATEARNPTGRLLDEHGLAQLLADVTPTTAEQTLTDLTQALATHTGTATSTPSFRTDDDTALLILRIPHTATKSAQ